VKTLVTGATGFVGKAVIDRLSARPGDLVRAAVRSGPASVPVDVERVVVGDLSPRTEWRHAIEGVDAVIHLAGRVHITREGSADALTEFRRINVAGTANLARQAAAGGVRRFIFISSVKVNGETGFFRETDPPAPEDAYAVSKHEAELEVRQIGEETGLKIVVIRPPLVYGPGARANFAALIRAVESGIPLPFGRLQNRRSFVALDNLVDFIVTCLAHPAAADETFLVSDGEDLSTTELTRRLARAMKRPVRLVPVPAPLLILAAAVLGKRNVARRLVGSLQVDISKARHLLGWGPPISVDEGLARAVSRSG
jgi:nucleoside-diphosphate-sugar epimerase